ncbi:MAG: hypothetical protein PHU93_03225 [Candidatus Gracilibacteria bacterium]|nr:hypothetical protein [Candidatus Gracilibacteria bacterium]
MLGTFNITKTFESKQKSVRGSLDLLVVHPNFWGALPSEYTQQKYIAGILRSGGSIKIQVPGYSEFYIKPIEFGDTRNGSYMLCGVLANTRQGGGVASAHLVDPDEVAAGKLNLLRNSDRHIVRTFVVHFAEAKSIASKGNTIKNLLNKEIPALAILDKKIDPISFLNKEIPALAILDKKIF